MCGHGAVPHLEDIVCDDAVVRTSCNGANEMAAQVWLASASLAKHKIRVEVPLTTWRSFQ